MTIEDLLNLLDYKGITYEDDELVADTLKDYGLCLSDKIIITTPGGVVLIGEEDER